MNQLVQGLRGSLSCLQERPEDQSRGSDNDDAA